MHPNGQLQVYLLNQNSDPGADQCQRRLAPSQASCGLAVSNREPSAMAPPLTGSLPRFRNTNDTTRSPPAPPYGDFQMSNRSIGRPQRALHVLKYSDADNFQPPSRALTYGHHASIAATLAGLQPKRAVALIASRKVRRHVCFIIMTPPQSIWIMLYPLDIP
jgi:hypothetical protein